MRPEFGDAARALLVRDVPPDAAMDAFAHPFAYAEPLPSRRVVETAPG